MRLSRLSLVLAVALAVSLVVRAGPFMPDRTVDLPDEAASLAGLERVHLDILALPQLLQDAGVRPSRLRQVLTGPLADAGVEFVEEDRKLPRLVVKTFVATERELPAAVSIGIVVAVHQSVNVQRLDRQLRVPTASVTKVTLATRDTVREVLERELRVVADALQRILRVATRKTKQ